MIFIVPLLVINSQICTQNMNSCPFPLRENIYKNSCDFEKIIISSKDVICEDYGQYTKLCNSIYFPKEFIITNFKGLNNEKIIDVTPNKIYSCSYNRKYKRSKLGELYYTFECEKKFKNPKLRVNIVPNLEIDISPKLILCQFIIVFMVFGFIIALLFKSL